LGGAPGIKHGTPPPQPELSFDQKLDHILRWFDDWGSENKWQFFTGLQAIDAAMMTEFYNNLYDLQV
jgi:hypothetical protein